MPFPATFLDELVARNPIEEVVGSYVSLTRRGSNYFGLCPFHNEKTPSFSVAPDKQMYYCFGCGKGGGVINFIMERENLSYPDAVRHLAKRVGMEVPEDAGHRENYRRRERLYALCKEAARFFHEQFLAPGGQAAREYAAKRGLSPACLTRFGIGYAPDGWRNLLEAMKAKGYEEQELLDAGLIVRKEQKGNAYDKFRNRLMFPIIDVRGNVIAFGGRVMGEGEPKYLNSPETEIFSKRRNLFALNVAKKTKRGYLILCEGYMDAITLHQYGFDCAVASLGTSLTEEHVKLLSNYTKELILTYDGDAAGQRASQRVLNILEKTNIRVRVLKMEGAKDPDEFLHRFGPERFERLLQGAESQTTYLLQNIRQKYDLDQDEQRVGFIKEAAQMIAGLPSAVEREVYGGRAAEAAGVTPQTLKTEVDRIREQRARQASRRQEKIDLSPMTQRQPKIRGEQYHAPRSSQAEEQILAMIIQEPGLCDEIPLEPEEFSSDLLGRAYDALREVWRRGGHPDLNTLAESFSAQEIGHLSSVLNRWDHVVSSRAIKDCVGIIRGHKKASQVKSAEDMMDYLKYIQEKKGLGANT